MSDTSTERQFIFPQKRRDKANEQLKKIEASIDRLKADSKDKYEFNNGAKFGLMLALGILAITIAESELDETIDEIISDLQVNLTGAVISLSLSNYVSKIMKRENE